jgi:hypothetical protein
MKTFSLKEKKHRPIGIRPANRKNAFCHDSRRPAGAVRQILDRPRLQAKLRVSDPKDVHEQEADRLADDVMRMPDETIQRQPLEEEEEMLQAKPVDQQTDCSELQRQVEEEEEEALLQARRDGGDTANVTPKLEQAILSRRGSGRPLSDKSRTFFEPRMGADLGNVKIHSDSQAADLARAIHARAFTVGSDIYFGAGRFSPESIEGKKLLAHELTHTIQQSGTLKWSLIQRDLRSDYSGQWGPAQTQLNAMYGGIGGVIDRQKGAVTDFLRYARISDQPSLAEQILINAINIVLGAVIPGVGSVIKSAAQSMVRQSLRGAVGSIVDSMVDAGKGAAQGAVTSAWSETAGEGTPVVQFAETQRRALETIAQRQIASMNQELARLLSTEGENDEWEAGDALYQSFQRSLDNAYDEQFNKMTDTWFTMQTRTIGGGARPGVLRITLERRYPDQGSFRIDSANLLGSGSVVEIRRRLAQRALQDITIPKFIQMNGRMGMGIMDCNWSIQVAGTEAPSSRPTLSAPRTRLEGLTAGPQRLTGYGGHRSWGWPWLAAFHLNLHDLDNDDPRNTDANRSSGAREVWEGIKNLSPGSIGASTW